MKRLLCLLCLAVAAVQAAGLNEKIERLLDASPAARAGFWGIQVVDLASGGVVYETNANRFFVPASNTKLFTTALALTRLGPGYRFTTTVRAESAPDAAGVVHGPLYLVGGGDPNLSARALPYRMGLVTGDPLAPIDALAAQVAARGVRRIEGDVVGDDTHYVWAPYPEGWGIDDPQFEYGAPVSALSVNDNAFTLTVRPGTRAGDLAALSLNPPLPFYRVDNRIRTAAGGERQIHFDRDPGGMQLRLWGSIPLGDRGADLVLGIEDPAAWAAAALRRALESRGIAIAGRATVRHIFPNQVADLLQAVEASTPPGAVELASRTSAPLADDLRVTDKVSQNLHAELALRAVARARRQIGSREAGVEEMATFLDEAGIDRSQYHLMDGSGLSRGNLVTAAAVVKLLRFLYDGPQRETWIGLLPIGGQDGTLSSRFGNPEATGRVHAKTGSLSHVSALSGYLQRRDGRWLAFSILTNNYNAPAGEVRGVMDRICTLVLESE
jgi:serine-type D-Ala-D-Ala carboxypeptidase/endopeptidase (penicillin-binding protein 4)